MKGVRPWRTPFFMATIGFDADIKPLFREKDRTSMLKAFDLWNYVDVVAHAQAILAAIASGKMPCDGAWPADKVETLRRWIDGGTPR
jgi:hypothetical protein